MDLRFAELICRLPTFDSKYRNILPVLYVHIFILFEQLSPLHFFPMSALPESFSEPLVLRPKPLEKFPAPPICEMPRLLPWGRTRPRAARVCHNCCLWREAFFLAIYGSWVGGEGRGICVISADPVYLPKLGIGKFVHHPPPPATLLPLPTLSGFTARRISFYKSRTPEEGKNPLTYCITVQKISHLKRGEMRE